jgi:hypothetical protein
MPVNNAQQNRSWLYSAVLFLCIIQPCLDVISYWMDIWRADNTKQTPFGAPLSEAVKLIERVCSEFAGVTVIRGGGFTPRLGEFYSDGYLHPNDLGFGFYAENLYPAIVKALGE